MHRRVAPLLSLTLLLAALLPAAQAQYKWKDKSGQVHASDLPPPRDVPDRDILQRPAPVVRPAAQAAPASPPASGVVTVAAPAASRASAGIDPELAARRKRAEQESKERQQAAEGQQAVQRAENCTRARQQLAGLQSGQRITRFNERGERVVMDDATRASEIGVAQRVVESECR